MLLMIICLQSNSTRLLPDVIDALDETFQTEPAAMSLLATETVVTFGSGNPNMHGVDLCPTSVDQSAADDDDHHLECGKKLERC